MRRAEGGGQAARAWGGGAARFWRGRIRGGTAKEKRRGGGAWSGRKGVAVRADLIQSGKILASTVKERSSGGGAFGGFKGTCAILDRVTAALAPDITAWLAQTALLPNGKTAPATATESQREREPTAVPLKTD